MTFPYESLVASTGRRFAYRFQNPAAGVPRGLYRGVTLEFESVRYEEETRSCSMTFEWIPWQVRTWQDLDGKSLSCNYRDQGVEASFYFVAHGMAENIRVSVAASEGAHCDVTMSMVVDLTGYTGGDANDEMSVSGIAVNLFDGVWLRPGNFDPARSSEAEIKALAGEFLDVSDFAMSEEPGGAFVFRPALGRRN